MKHPFVIGIAGGSASGKTTFCQKLEDSLGGMKVKSIHMDSYFKPAENRPRGISPITNIDYLDDNHPETADLPQLQQDLEQALTEDYDVIIVEGLLVLYHDGICGLLDLKLFVDCQADERIVRRLQRNMGYGLTFDEISTIYLDLVRYRHAQYVEPYKWRADLILNGSNFSETALQMVVAKAQGEMEQK